MIFSYLLHQVDYLILDYRNASDSNEQNDIEIDTARVAAEQDVAKNCEQVLQHIDCEFYVT